MLLKIILVLIVLFGLYKLFGGRLPQRNKKEIDAQTLIECQKCGTFVAQKEALVSRGKYYCSRSCKISAKES